MRVIGGQEPHADVVLQKRVHAVERPARRTAGNGDEVVADNDPQLLRTHRGSVECGRAARQGFTRADQHVPVGSVRGGNDPQFDPGGLGEHPAKLPGSVRLARRCIFRDDDVPAGKLGQVDAPTLGGSRSNCESGQPHQSDQY